MKTILVTGAAGFIGQHVVPLLRDSGWSVHGVARSHRPDLDADVTWHRLDLLQESEAPSTLMLEVKPDCLLHLAWIATPGVYWTSPENERWVAASLALVDAFCEAGGRRIVAAGTCAEYDWGSGLCSEDRTPLAPSTPYGEAKLKLFQRLSAWSEAGHADFTWGRIFHLYGPHEHPQRLIPSVILSLLQGREARTTIGDQVRGFLHVSDVAAAFSRLVESDATGAINVGSADAVTIADVVRLIAELLGARDRARLGALPTPAGDPPKILADNAKLRALGWMPNVPLTAGLHTTADWWRRQIAHNAGPSA